MVIGCRYWTGTSSGFTVECFETNGPETETDQLAFTQRLVPDEACAYDLTLLDFGALVRQPEPLCEECFANEYCAYFQELARHS